MKIIKRVLFFVMLFIFIFSLCKLISYKQEDLQNEQLIVDLKEDNVEIIDLPQTEIEEPEKEFAPISVDFKALQETNKDIIGWLYQPNTKINYPIVQGVDNNQYLRRLINGKYNVSGTIFLDYRNDKTFNDFYSIIYGHNIKGKNMFGSLPGYKKQEYYDKNPTLYLLTPATDFKIELFMGFVYKANYEDFVFNPELTQEDLDILLDLSKKSTFNSNIVPTLEDKVVMLSTCSYEYSDARYVVFGILKKLDKIEEKAQS